MSNSMVCMQPVDMKGVENPDGKNRVFANTSILALATQFFTIKPPGHFRPLISSDPPS